MNDSSKIFYFFYRLLLKNASPFTKESFVIGDTAENLRLGLDDKNN